MTPPSLSAIAGPVIDLVPQETLRDALRRAFAEEGAALGAIERAFDLVPQAPWSRGLLCTWLGSWKATHLKMLAIYGLSCRLHRLADAAAPAHRDALFVAAARNAATSHEDLGLDFDARTHAELYDELAAALVDDDSWQLGRHRLPEAAQFGRWVYRNMVVEDLRDGLCTNMFSEIYNHAEYSRALPAFDAYFTRHTEVPPDERRRALAYIEAHVTDDTEADHFMVVVEALDRYGHATGQPFDPARAEGVFRAYLRRLAPVMERLTRLMLDEMPAARAGWPAGQAQLA